MTGGAAGQDSSHEVGAALRSIWAKTDARFGNELTTWLPLTQHLDDAAMVAGWLWDHWLADSVRDRISAAVGSRKQARALLVFLAATHDIGKATPIFAIANGRLAERMRQAGLHFPREAQEHNRSRLYHDLAGHIILRRYLEQKGWSLQEADALAGVVGAHHGVPAERDELYLDVEKRALMGEGAWGACRNSLLEWATTFSEIDLPRIRRNLPDTATQSALLGAVVVSDWIASHDKLFPLVPVDSDVGDPSRRLEVAMRELRFPPRIKLERSTQSAQKSFVQRWPTLKGARVNAVQAVALEQARDTVGARLMVIEAPMGSGKTEAAMLAAEELASQSGASGFFFALPTQATSNAMFSRVMDWLETLEHRAGREISLSLLHGKAKYQADFRMMRRGAAKSLGTSRIMDQDQTTGRPGFVHHWMLSPRRSPLNDVVVGTIDQVLFMALQARHVALRHLGLAGKVVVIDEVHSYDAYMGVYLRRTLSWLGALGVPVVLLSATLPATIKHSLIQAYENGRNPEAQPGDLLLRGRRRRLELSAEGDEPPSAPSEPSSEYPVVTTVGLRGPVAQAVELHGRPLEVQLKLGDDSIDTLISTLRDRLNEGGCAVVIRNTVGRAQQTYKSLERAFGSEAVTLAHSRFMDADRAELDASLVHRFGKNGQQRPHRHIVVATQVVEQSLDLDFDLMITDIAPTDLLLQRVGRLHRHDRLRPRPVADPICVVTGVERWDSSPVQVGFAAAAVYELYDLLQATALVHRRVSQGRPLKLPDDIAPWVHAAYSSAGTTPANWSEHVAEAAAKRQRNIAEKERGASVFALPSPHDRSSLVGWLGRSLGDIEEGRGRAQVRDAEESYEAVLLFRNEAGDIVLPHWIATAANLNPESAAYPTDEQSAVVASCSVRVSARQIVSQGGDVDRWIDECWAVAPAAWRESRELRQSIALVLDITQGGEGGSGNVGGCWFDYSRELGLQVKRPSSPKDSPATAGSTPWRP